MEQIRAYILTVTAAGMLCAIIQTLAGTTGNLSALIRLMTGVVLCLVVILPLRDIPSINLTGYLNQLERNAAAAVNTGTEAANLERETRITRAMESYILDKAAELSLDVAVVLQLDSAMVPTGLTITGNASPYARQVMESIITEELGIPMEAVQWN